MAIKTAGLHTQVTRRTALGGVAAMAAAPALAEDCRIGPPPHEKGPLVWMDMDQLELDAAYDQAFYAPLRLEVIKRLASNSEAVRGRIGQPVRESYGPTEVEKLDIYRTKRANAPIFVFIHGGAWLGGEAKNYAFAAEMFVNAGAHYVGLDFIAIKEAGGDLRVMAIKCAAESPGSTRMPRNLVVTGTASILAAIRREGISAASPSSRTGKRTSGCRQTW